LSAYLDESGTHSKNLMILGGFVSTSGRWSDFARECDDIASFFKIETFHMKELRNGNSKRYRHLSVNKRKEMLGCVLHAIREHTMYGIFDCLIPFEYESLSTPLFRSKFGSAYSLCVNGCILVMWDLLTGQSRKTESISIFLEHGHKNAVEAMRVIGEYKYSTDPLDLSQFESVVCREEDPLRGPGLKVATFGLGDKKSMRPLWAADVLAYCTHGLIMSRGNDPFCAGVIDAIEEKVKYVGHSWNEDSIKSAIADVEEGEAARKLVRSDTYSLKKYLRSFRLDVRELPVGLLVDRSNTPQEDLERFLFTQKDAKP